MGSKLFQKKGGPKLAKKKEDVWEPERPYVHLHAYMSVDEFLDFFNRGLKQHFERSNSLFQKDLTFKKFDSKPLNLEIINNLNLTKVDYTKFPLVKLLKNLNDNSSQYETVLISINDFFVSKFLKRKISYLELIKLIKFHANSKNFLNFRKLPVKNVTDVEKTRNYVYSKLETLGI